MVSSEKEIARMVTVAIPALNEATALGEVIGGAGVTPMASW